MIDVHSKTEKVVFSCDICRCKIAFVPDDDLPQSNVMEEAKEYARKLGWLVDWRSEKSAGVVCNWCANVYLSKIVLDYYNLLWQDREPWWRRMLRIVGIK